MNYDARKYELKIDIFN